MQRLISILLPREQDKIKQLVISKCQNSISALISLGLISMATPVFACPSGGHRILTLSPTGVEIKVNGRNQYQPAKVDNSLSNSDYIRLARGASAVIYCENASIWNITSQGTYQVSQGCSSTKRRRNCDDTLRPINDPSKPYLISPRKTQVLTNQPIIRWNAVEGATSYKVEVSGAKFDWETTVSQTEVVYSGEQALEPGYYKVTITTDKGLSNKTDNEPGFVVLSDGKVEEITAEIEQLQQQLPDDESQVLAQIYLYRSHRLNAAAIELLETLVQEGDQTEAIYQILGETYDLIGLPRLAREPYVKALELSRVNENLEGQASNQVSLGEIDVALGQVQQAVEWLKAAQNVYRALGDEAQVEKLQSRLDYLETKLN